MMVMEYSILLRVRTSPSNRINAMDKAAEMKNAKVFNMIVLGGLLKVCPVVSTDGLKKALFKSLPERHHNLIPLNMEAVEEGMKIITQQ